MVWVYVIAVPVPAAPVVIICVASDLVVIPIAVMISPVAHLPSVEVSITTPSEIVPCIPWLDNAVNKSSKVVVAEIEIENVSSALPF